MTTASLFDDAARSAVATQLECNLFVEAGAGTGKTSALVARFVALVERGTPIAQIAAITFTEAAAAELRERVREALGEAATAEGPQADRCLDALTHFDDATISTLHAFAQRVLAEFPVEAGLPPGFEVLDAIQAQIEFAERWSRFLDRVHGDAAHHRALRVAGALGFRMSRLEALTRLIHDDWDRLADTRPPSTRPVPGLELDAALAALEHAAGFADHCGDPADLLLEHLTTKVVPLREALRSAVDEDAALDALARRPATLACSRGRQRNWPDKAAVVAACERADTAVEACVAAVTEPAIAQLLARAVDLVEEMVDDRRRTGRLVFHDLLVLARDLVRDDAGVREVLHVRFRHLLLDEFQDTDPLQIELAVRIATDDPAAGTKPWWACPVPAGRLFVVGDPKQSIYRFRRADIELYHRVRDAFGDRLALTTSFRSRPGIVDFVNHVFASLLDDREARGLQASHEALLPHRDAGGPAVTVVGAEHEKRTDLAWVRRLEAQELAALIRRVRDEGWPVARRLPDGSERTEPARFADIAVLLPTRATLPYLEHALEDAQVPARIESQSLVYATAEVQELLAILTAIDDPADAVATVAALRAPAFACRDDKLAEYREAGGRWDCRAPAPPGLPPEHPVVAAMAGLHALHRRRWWDSVSETVERVVRERRLLELATARPRPRDHWRRIRLVTETARAFVDGGGTSLRGFVSWLAQQVEEEARVVEVVVPEPDDDAVRILTVHGAKGLEFPVVVLAGLGVVDRAQIPAVLWDAEGTPQVQIGPRDRRGPGFRYLSPGYESCADHERAAGAAEQIRLLYVAATRARDHLAVSIHHRTGDTSHASRLIAPLAAAPQLWLRQPTIDGVSAGVPAVAAASPPVHGDDGDDGTEWLARRAQRIAAGRRRPVAAATALKDAARADEDVARDGHAAKHPPEAQSAAYRRGRGGTAVGRAVHAVLQTVDLATGAGLDATARAQALAEGVPEREPEIRALAAASLVAPTLREAVEQGWPCWREVPVAAMVDDVLVEGFVDLLLESPDGLVVVDYKTDQVGSDVDVDAAVARYEVQGGAYALALETALGRPVTRCVFVFARHDTAVERDVEDLRAAIGRAREAVAVATAPPAG